MLTLDAAVVLISIGFLTLGLSSLIFPHKRTRRGGVRSRNAVVQAAVSQGRRTLANMRLSVELSNSRAEWDHAVDEALRRNGQKPDAILRCYSQDCSDGRDTMEYLDAGIGVFRRAKVIRIVRGEDNSSIGKDFEIGKAQELEFSKITKIIERERRTPSWGGHFRASDGTYPTYKYYFQTRVYVAKDVSYAPKGQVSIYRLLESRADAERVGPRSTPPGHEVFEWLCRETGADNDTDTQDEPLDGYPEGV